MGVYGGVAIGGVANVRVVYGGVAMTGRGHTPCRRHLTHVTSTTVIARSPSALQHSLWVCVCVCVCVCGCGWVGVLIHQYTDAANVAILYNTVRSPFPCNYKYLPHAVTYRLLWSVLI